MKHGFNPKVAMFLIGLGALTKVFFLGCLGLSEMVVFVLAPFLFYKNAHILKREGFMPFIALLLLYSLSLIFSCVYHDSSHVYCVKGLAVDASIFAHMIVFHHLVRKDSSSVGWFFIGLALSGLITIFAFNPKAFASEDAGFAYIGSASADEVIEGPLFWISRVQSFLELPLFCAYPKVPSAYIVAIIVAIAVVTNATSASGRSATLIVFLGGLMMLLGGRTRESIERARKHFVFVFVALIIGALFFKSAYSYLATSGYLSDEQREKYFMQSRRGSSALSILMMGRIEPFVGFRALLDHPIVGYGPRPIDTKGYYSLFLEKWGGYEDVQNYMAYQARRQALGRETIIPSHSHIIGAWIERGIVGLMFWLYILYLMMLYLRKYSSTLPHLFGYGSMATAFYLWHIFFSPPGTRPLIALYIVVLLLAKGIGEGRVKIDEQNCR